MAKRKADFDEESPRSKKKKLSRGVAPGPDIRTSEDLHSLLSSTQLDVDQLLQRVKTFKSFLDGIIHTESPDRDVKISLLLSYLRPCISTRNGGVTQNVPDLIALAHHAGHINSENLFSSTVAVLALLLKTVSTLYEFCDIGNFLCRLLLYEDHIKLLEHGMSAAKHKEHLISPSLRLLKEIVLFDSGKAAKAVYRLRQVTYQRLDVFLAMRGGSKDDEVRNRKRQSVRNTAISYLLANIRLQGPNGKCYILGQSRWMRLLLSDMSSDPPALVCAMLNVLQKEVAEDEALPLSVKGRFFDEWTMSRLVSLYGYDNYSSKDAQDSVESSVHELLETICASPNYSLLAALEKKRSQDSRHEDGHDSSEEGSSNRERVDTRKIQQNVISLLRRLRPHASLPQSDLLLSSFQAFPRLLGDYFSERAAFSFDPKLSAAWIGYSQLLLGIIQQPLPRQVISICARGDQHGLDLLTHFILPPPLTQKALTQGLNHKSNLITFFTTRILVAAFGKFATAKEMLSANKQQMTGNPGATHIAIENKLCAAFCNRLPRIKDVVVRFKTCLDQNTTILESISRLLLLYTAVPELVVEEKIDHSLAVSNALVRTLEATQVNEKNDGMLLLALEHDIDIAFRLPDMHWWHQTGNSFLPFTYLLKQYVGQQPKDGQRIGKLLRSVAEEDSVIWPGGQLSGSDALVLSLRLQAKTDTADVYAFLDNCFQRVAKKTVIYAEQLQHLLRPVLNTGIEDATRCLPDLLTVAFIEQLPHFIARQSDGPIAAVTRFLRLHVDITAYRNMDEGTILLVRNALTSCFAKDDERRRFLAESLPETLDAEVRAAIESLQRMTDDLRNIPMPSQQADVELQLEPSIPTGPPDEDENHRGLIRWKREDVLDALADGAVEELILCLCSAHEEIRRQALAGIRAFNGNLERSGYKEWQQMHLMVGELAETVGSISSEQPLPYFAGVLAARLLQVLDDPLHIMYEKVNTFLSRRPQWNPDKLPSYWVDKIVLHPPTNDDSHYQEIEWLLDLLIDGLRDAKDMDLYRRCHTIERMLSLAESPKLPMLCLEKILDLLFRCTYVNGSTTLITRCGLISWLSINIAIRDDSLKAKMKVLGWRIYESSDQTRVNEWSNGSLVAMLKSANI